MRLAGKVAIVTGGGSGFGEGIVKKFIAEGAKLGSFSTPEDLGNAAAFLCSDEASMITGAAMEVDGGRCI